MNNILLNDACRLIHEVKELTGRGQWERTVAHLKGHYTGASWDSQKARDLIRRHVREAKQALLSSADTPAVDIATDFLLLQIVLDYRKDKRECRHPRKQRQSDEYYCPDCNKRWDADDGGNWTSGIRDTGVI